MTSDPLVIIGLPIVGVAILFALYVVIELRVRDWLERRRPHELEANRTAIRPAEPDNNGGGEPA